MSIVLPAESLAVTPPVEDGAVVLRDGSTLRVRPIRAGDEQHFREFLATLSEQSLRLRYFSRVVGPALDREAHRQSTLDAVRSFGIVAITGADDRIVAHAECAAVNSDRAEVAFAVADAYQGLGIGSILLGRLAEIATTRGITVFEASVLPENHGMLAVFRESGFPMRTRVLRGEMHVEFPIELTEQAREPFDHREATAAVNAVRWFLRPRSVAVIGASRSPEKIGGAVLQNLVANAFAGRVVAVNPGAGSVQNVPTYRTVEDIPGPLDLAVIVVPAAKVLEAARACARRGVHAVVVISAGFAEAGAEGRVRQDALLRICRTSGMRLIGPNSMGVINTDPAVRLDATFAPTVPPAGRVAFMSQSGALGIAMMEHAASMGLGLSSFVSVGNKADISGNDLLRYWEQDANTDVVLLYLESFGNPRKFARIARAVAQVKPIVAVKSGRSPAGARATGSHTGALIEASDVSVDALFRQAGVIRTDRLDEMFDVAALLATQPLPKGNRVAIVTNAGGPGILCADACATQQLEIAALDPATEAALRALLPPEATVTNPVDMIASATADQYGEAIRLVAGDPNVDAVVVIFIPPLVTRAADVARAIVASVWGIQREKPVLAVFMQSSGVPRDLHAADVRIPSYAFPEHAAIALGHATRYADWRRRPPQQVAPIADARRDEGAAIVAAAIGRGDGWLGAGDLRALLDCYGIPVAEQRVAATPEDAARAAAALGGTVVLKAIGRGIVHKTELGAVRVNLAPDAVESAAREMGARLRERAIDEFSFLVQRMVSPGVEMIVGVVHDRHFGPLVACGAGGYLVELLKDVSVRLGPLSHSDAEEMIRELGTYPLFAGYRGGPPRDAAALADVIVRVSAMVEDLPQIVELDLNPVIVHETGAVVVDARVRVAPSSPDAAPHPEV